MWLGIIFSVHMIGLSAFYFIQWRNGKAAAAAQDAEEAATPTDNPIREMSSTDNPMVDKTVTGAGSDEPEEAEEVISY